MLIIMKASLFRSKLDQADFNAHDFQLSFMSTSDFYFIIRLLKNRIIEGREGEIRPNPSPHFVISL